MNASVVFDLLMVLGVGLIAAGLWIVSLPAALIFLGLVFSACGYLGAKAWVYSHDSSRRGSSKTPDSP